MLKKEIINVTKQTLCFLIMVFTAPGLLIVTIIRDASYFQVFFPLLQYGLLFWALFMGISLFSSEQDQHGMEYLLSLPYTRLHLIGLKILPRAVVVLALYLFCWLLYANGGGNAAVLPHFSFTILYFAVFCIALSYSAISDNFLVLFVFTMFTMIAYLGILSGIFWATLQAKGYIFYEFEIMPFFTEGLDSFLENLIVPVSIGILLPFLIALFFSFKKFDVRPVKTYNVRFLKAFIPLFILGLIGGFVFSHQTLDIGYTNYYLTQDLQVIESNEYSGVKIYDGQKVHRVELDVSYYWPSWEDNGFVYYRDGSRLGRLNISEQISEILYEAPRGKRIPWRIWGYEETMVFLESKGDYTDIQFVLLDLKSREAKKIPLAGESLGEYSDWIIFGADEDEGRRYWLMHPGGIRDNKPIYLLWEDGQITSIGMTQKWSCYINRTLLSYAENEIILSKLREGKLETIQRIPNRDDLHFGWYLHYQRKLINSPVNEIYGRKVYHSLKDENAGQNYVAKYARLDLENLEIEEMAEMQSYLAFYASDTDSFYALEWDEPAHEVKLYLVKKGTPELMKTFEDVDPEYGLNAVDIARSGILVKKGKKIKVYAWPDLKEIKFRRL
jgi:hypothetical protein